MKQFVLLLPLLLAACERTPIYTPVTVKVPLSVPCKTPAMERPAAPVIVRNASMFDLAKAALAENEQAKAYIMQLEAALQACQESGPTSALWSRQ